MNPILIDHVIEKITNIIYSEKELIGFASDKVIEDGVGKVEIQSSESDYKEPAISAEKALKLVKFLHTHNSLKRVKKATAKSVD